MPCRDYDRDRDRDYDRYSSRDHYDRDHYSSRDRRVALTTLAVSYSSRLLQAVSGQIRRGVRD